MNELFQLGSLEWWWGGSEGRGGESDSRTEGDKEGGAREVRARQEKAVGLAFPPGGTSQGQFEP